MQSLSNADLGLRLTPGWCCCCCCRSVDHTWVARTKIIFPLDRVHLCLIFGFPHKTQWYPQIKEARLNWIATFNNIFIQASSFEPCFWKKTFCSLLLASALISRRPEAAFLSILEILQKRKLKDLYLRLMMYHGFQRWIKQHYAFIHSL